MGRDTWHGIKLSQMKAELGTPKRPLQDAAVEVEKLLEAARDLEKKTGKKVVDSGVIRRGIDRLFRDANEGEDRSTEESEMTCLGLALGEPEAKGGSLSGIDLSMVPMRESDKEIRLGALTPELVKEMSDEGFFELIRREFGASGLPSPI